MDAAKEVYEPLDHIETGSARMLTNVSGPEVLLHDVRLVGRRLVAVGVPVELRVWPGQMNAFQIAARVVPEATRSLPQVGNHIRDAIDPNYGVTVCVGRRAQESQCCVITDSA